MPASNISIEESWSANTDRLRVREENGTDHVLPTDSFSYLITWSVPDYFPKIDVRPYQFQSVIQLTKNSIMTEIGLQPTLLGKNITLRPLLIEDFSDLYQAAADPIIWELHPDSSRYKRDIFKERFFDEAIASGGALAIIDNESGRIIGSSRFYKWNPDNKEISIGYTFLERAQWGSGTNKEMKRLMLDHIFSYADTVWFGVAEINLRSRRAVEKLGAALSHRENRELEGQSYVQLYYQLSSSTYST